MDYDYLIVGAGFFGSICAHELTKVGKKVLVIDSRNHIGGNCYTENRDGINLHVYGPHVFHTSNKEVWEWINQFAEFNNYHLQTVAKYKDEVLSLPFSMWTFSKLWNIASPSEAKSIIEQQSAHIGDPTNLEEQAIKLVGTDIYEKLIKGYTAKQWKKDPKQLPKEIIKRLPVRFTYDNNYFNDKYQGIPVGGYTQIFENLLKGVEVRLGVDYLQDKELWKSKAAKVIYTGPIDRYYSYQFGQLEYKTTAFEHSKKDIPNFQGAAVVNYTDIDVEQTRIIEHKYFENTDTPHTWITKEIPVEYQADLTEPYYPVNDKENTEKYKQYRDLAEQESNTLFGGRLAEYKYYDMHQVIASALHFIKKEIHSNDT